MAVAECRAEEEAVMAEAAVPAAAKVMSVDLSAMAGIAGRAVETEVALRRGGTPGIRI